jgi:C6 transcription factor Pro1
VALGASDSKVQLRNIMGCENWVMILIREIAVLDDWKRRMMAGGVLSVRELVRKSGSIEERLETGIANLTANLTELVNSAKGVTADFHEKISKHAIVKRATHAFACATRVYLNAVISGPNPNLLEIRDSVARTIDALAALPDPQLVRSVVWPFCIAGCMVGPDQEQSFRDLAFAAEINEKTFGTSWRALEVMETCWLVRQSPDINLNDCDWFGAMKRLGKHVLLV